MNTNWNDPNFQGFKGEMPFVRAKKVRKPRKAVGTPVTRTIINIVVMLVFAALYFYVVLPALNFKAGELYIFVLLVCAVYGLCAIFTSGFQGEGWKGYFGFLKKQCLIPLIIAAVFVLTAVVGSILGWQVIRANDYRDLLTVEDGDFAAEVEEISYSQIPMVDKNSAVKLGNRKLGELADMVSQFEVMENYTQINYEGRPVRVTSLRYGDIIKWFTNRSEGLPAYIIIDMVTQDVDVIRLEEGIRYTTAEHFGRNLYRHLRFNYPTYMFDAPAFEIDETGHPYWVCPRMDKTIGLFGGTDIIGAVLVGVNFAKAAAMALNKPLIPVHHIRGHIAANYIAYPELEPPFLCLVVSGGHTMIIEVKDYTDMQILGTTLDDAAGECFDKVGRVLGMPYPGGAALDKMSQTGDEHKYTLPVAKPGENPYNMSFSGLKTATLNLIHHAEQVGEELDVPSLCAAFAAAVSDTLVPRVVRALQETGYKKVAVAGGVAANSRVRKDMLEAARNMGVEVYMPPLKLCGDNGAMIGAQGYYEYLAGNTADMSLNAYATKSILGETL
mgnify:CR=1 FL=1